MERSANQKERESEPHNIEEVLDRLTESAEGEEQVSIGMMMEAVGRRSFGPVVLVVGLIAASPLSGIPTLPSILGIMVVLVAGQLLLGQKHFWLPKKVLKRSISSSKLRKGLDVVRPAGRFIDRFLRPRLCFMTRGSGTYVIALLCVVIGITMPPLEILPFLASIAGIALAFLGLALISHDGVLALIAIAVTGTGGYLAITQLLGGGG